MNLVRFRLAIILAFLSLALPSCQSRPKQSKSPQLILFVTIDTLRPDHLQSYGYPRSTAPFIHSLAQKGIIFDKVISTSSHTSPSHSSMFTSLYPFEHGVLKNHDTLAKEHRNLHQVLTDSGYQAVALPAVRFMEGKVGFPLLDPTQDIPEAKISKRFWYRNATQQVNRAIHVLESVKPSDKFFLWLHFYDVHEWSGKASLPEQYLTTFDNSDADTIVPWALDKHKIPLEFHETKENLLQTMDKYDRRIRYVDDELARLFQELSARGLDKSMWCFITSDHGEGLGNHDYVGHGEHIYNEQLRIPLVVYSSTTNYAGRRVAPLVRSVDFFPTIAELVEHPNSDDKHPRRGYSLLPFVRDPQFHPMHADSVIDPDLAFSQRRPKDLKTFRKTWEEGDVFALQTEDYKIIYHTDAPNEFYDLSTDPFELKNISGANQPQEKLLLEKIMALLHSAPEPSETSSPNTLTPDEVDELKTLGYM